MGAGEPPCTALAISSLPTPVSPKSARSARSLPPRLSRGATGPWRGAANHLGWPGPFWVEGSEGFAALAGEPLQQQGVVEGGGGQSPTSRSSVVADAVELGRVHAVYGQGADQRLIREERQADAGVHLEVVVIRQQAVIGVGQGAVGRKRTTSPARAMASRRG